MITWPWLGPADDVPPSNIIIKRQTIDALRQFNGRAERTLVCLLRSYKQGRRPALMRIVYRRTDL